MAEHKTTKISIGITSLTVILCVLCLTVFSVLTLSTALSERKFSDKRATEMQEYYAAESEAAILVNEMQNVLEQNEDVYAFAEQNGMKTENNIFRFQKIIDEGQELEVVLQLSDKIEIKTWQVVSTAEWTPDNSLNVWDGTIAEE